jgi:hypothetical protein
MVRNVDPAAGIEWLKGGWAAFKVGGATLIGMGLTLMVLAIVLSFFGIIGRILLPIVMTFGYAGILKGLREHAAGGELRYEHLWSVLKDQDKLVHIAIVALVPVLGSILSSALGDGFLAWIIGFAISLIVTALTYFAVPLVLFRQQDAIKALEWSLRGVLANVPAVVVYWLICVVLFIVAVIPIGLGLLVLIPVLMGAAYEAYAEVYGDVEIVPNAPVPGGEAPPPPPAA